ncbi:uncharacterized protein LOC116252070 [Nymphaea colorata]|nr:uncharacterized protein LOC116252070 [Nymphaea colorata]
MVGIFSRFSSGRGSHRRTRSSMDEVETVLPDSEINSDVALVIPHEVETVGDFKPIEHPTEPPDSDHPVTCPAPEPSISNDGKMWKERIAGNSRRQSDVSVLKDEETQGPPEIAVIKYASPASMPVRLPVGVPDKQKRETSEEV